MKALAFVQVQATLWRSLDIKRYQVFVSSTFTDLQAERQAILESILDLKQIPVGMEHFVAANEEQFNHIKKLIDETDYYVIIIGNRYGTIAEDGVSYTEKEFDYAVSKGVPILAFIHASPDSLPFEKSEADPKTRKELERFREKVKENRLVSLFPWNSPDSLAKKVVTALSNAIQENPRPGWVREKNEIFNKEADGNNGEVESYHGSGAFSRSSEKTHIEKPKKHDIKNKDALFLGNGFNLSYHLPTTYINFLNTMEVLCDNSSNEYNTVGDVFRDQQLLSSDAIISRAFSFYGHLYNEVVLDQNELRYMRELALRNGWFLYFRSKNDNKNGWIDFEKEIKTVLSNVSQFFSKIRYHEKLSHITVIDEEPNDYLKEIFRCFSFGDIEFSTVVAMARRSLTKTDNITRRAVNWEKRFESKDHSQIKYSIIAELEASLQDFARLFSYYLHQFVDAPLPLLEKEMPRYKVFQSADVVITTDFTHLYETLYKSQDNTIVYHTNGEVANGSNIVFGINDDNDSDKAPLSNEFLPFKKSFQRAVFQTDSYFTQFIREATSSAINYHLIVFGHSLAFSEKDVIKKLFGVSVSITIFCHSIRARVEYVKNLISIFGQEEFERLRISKNLRFVSLETIE